MAKQNDPKENGTFSYAFTAIETQEDRERVEAFLERINDLADGDIVSSIGKSAVVRTDSYHLLRLLNIMKGAKKQKRDETGLSCVAFPMLLPEDLEALEELIDNASRLLSGADGPVKASFDLTEIVICNTRSEKLARVLAGYAEKIPNAFADFGLE